MPRWLITSLALLTAATLSGGALAAPGTTKSSTPAKPETKPATATTPAHGAATPAKTTTPATKAPAAAPTTNASDAVPKKETVEEIVARIQKRLAGERSTSVRRVAAAPQAPPPRVSLTWRHYVTWPSELVGEPGQSGDAPGRVALAWETQPDPNRVTLDWKDDGQAP
jgi:hypothetical protein